jgi:hypothetical protein
MVYPSYEQHHQIENTNKRERQNIKHEMATTLLQLRSVTHRYSINFYLILHIEIHIFRFEQSLYFGIIACLNSIYQLRTGIIKCLI